MDYLEKLKTKIEQGKRLTNTNIYAIVNGIKPVCFNTRGTSISFEFIVDDRFEKDLDTAIYKLQDEFIEKANTYKLDYRMSNIMNLRFPPERAGEKSTYQKRIAISITKPKYVRTELKK